MYSCPIMPPFSTKPDVGQGQMSPVSVVPVQSLQPYNYDSYCAQTVALTLPTSPPTIVSNIPLSSPVIPTSPQAIPLAMGSPTQAFSSYPPAVTWQYVAHPMSMSYPPTVTSSNSYWTNDQWAGSLTTRMEVVWHSEFDKLYQQFLPDVWSLAPTFEQPQGDDWKIFKDSAKVRFNCSRCSNCWTSMKGRVVFWHLFEPQKQSGQVLFKLFGQQCQRCDIPDQFEHAMWYPEEVVKVIGNVFNRIGQLHYGFMRPPLRIDRRQGRPRDQHNSARCAACKAGLCRDEWQFT